VNADEDELRYIRSPRRLPAFPEAIPVKPKTPVQGGGGLRPRWRDTKGRIYEWDKRHGNRDLRQNRENDTGRVRSGERQAAGTSQPAQKGRAMKKPPKEDLALGFVLQGFNRVTDELRIELHLEAAPMDRLRSLFDVREDVAMSTPILWMLLRPMRWRP
jgi:Cytotoxic